MIRIPQFVVYAIVALNITAFALLLQMDWLIFDSVAEKLAAWLVAAVVWQIAYMRRDRVYIVKI